MIFPCGFRRSCAKPSMWCVQSENRSVIVCQDHKHAAEKWASEDFKYPVKTWRDGYFDGGEQLELPI